VSPGLLIFSGDGSGRNLSFALVSDIIASSLLRLGRRLLEVVLALVLRDLLMSELAITPSMKRSGSGDGAREGNGVCVGVGSCV